MPRTNSSDWVERTMAYGILYSPDDLLQGELGAQVPTVGLLVSADEAQSHVPIDPGLPLRLQLVDRRGGEEVQHGFIVLTLSLVAENHGSRSQLRPDAGTPCDPRAQITGDRLRGKRLP
ncbi:MAG: hypothetical protein ABIQ53_00910 [Terracoccus sp.]